MELNPVCSNLSLLQEQVSAPSFKPSLFRDSDFAKQALEAFKVLEKKYSKKLSVNSLNAKLIDDHLLPMLVAADKSSGETITQLFNFVDHFPTKAQITPESKLIVNLR